MKNNFFVSVIMSTYNTDKNVLDLSINSVLYQTYNNFEFFIVCDGSLEEYEYIRNKYNDNRIKLILHKTNKGLPFSLNEAIKKSKGDFIMRMDSDDICNSRRMEKQIKYFIKNPQIDILGTNVKTFGNYTSKYRQFFINYKEIAVEKLYIPVLVHPTVMFRRKIFDEGNFYDVKFLRSQDYEFWSRLKNNYNISILPFFGLDYRIHSSQAGFLKRQEQLDNTKYIHKKNIEFVFGKSNDKYENLFGMFYGYNELNKNNLNYYLDTIDNFINEQKVYEQKYIKKVFYNRLLIQIIKSKNFICIFNMKVIKRIFNFTNIKYVMWKIIWR